MESSPRRTSTKSRFETPSNSVNWSHRVPWHRWCSTLSCVTGWNFWGWCPYCWRINYTLGKVSHFVKPDAAIDKEAAHRCTTVYLVDRRTDMLPKLLTENLCSLVCNVDHLTFSVIWVMDSNAKVINLNHS